MGKDFFFNSFFVVKAFRRGVLFNMAFVIFGEGTGKTDKITLVFLKNFYSSFEKVFFVGIISIAKGDKISGRLLNTLFVGAYNTSVRLVYHLDFFILKTVADFKGVIGAAIVYENYFPVFPALIFDGVYCFFYCFLCIVDRYDN